MAGLFRLQTTLKLIMVGLLRRGSKSETPSVSFAVNIIYNRFIYDVDEEIN